MLIESISRPSITHVEVEHKLVKRSTKAIRQAPIHKNLPYPPSSYYPSAYLVPNNKNGCVIQPRQGVFLLGRRVEWEVEGVVHWLAMVAMSHQWKSDVAVQCVRPPRSQPGRNFTPCLQNFAMTDTHSQRSLRNGKAMIFLIGLSYD